MISSKKYFLFDVDGVVASSIDFFTGLWKELSEELGAPKSLPLSFYRDKIGSMFDTWLLPIIPKENHTKVNDAFNSRAALADNPFNTPLVDGALKALTDLHQAGKKIAFISTKPRKPMNAFIEHFQLTTLVDFSICGDEVTHYKPNPEGINKALSFFNAKPTEAIFIGDSLHDLGAARNANVPFIGVLTGIANAEVWIENNAAYVNSIKEL